MDQSASISPELIILVVLFDQGQSLTYLARDIDYHIRSIKQTAETHSSGKDNMNLCLILSINPASHEAETIWRKACEDSGDTLEIVNTENSKYQPLVEQLHLNTFPALLQDNRVLAVGIPTLESARKLLTVIATSRRH